MTIGGRFIGVGVTTSTGAADELPAAVPDVEQFRTALADHYDGLTHPDPDESAVQELLTQLRGTRLTGPLLVYWSGHGAAFGDDLRLLATNSGDSAADGTPAAEVARNAATTGSPQVLIIIDTCHSGTALPTAGAAIALAQAVHPPDADHAWAGVLVSARTGEAAADGAFGQHLYRLLTEGPATTEMKLQWEPYSEFIRASDFGIAVQAEWPQSSAQRPDFGQRGPQRSQRGLSIEPNLAAL